MATTIQQFYQVAQNRDFARLFQFQIETFGNINFSDKHLAYVESASLPGRSITNIPVTYMGMDFNTPGTVKYPGSTGYKVTFRCDQNYDIRGALEAASFNTFDEATSSGEYGIPGTDYKLVMQLFDKNFKPVRYYVLFGVWVQSLDDVAYDVKDTGTVQTVSCTLAYQFWRSGAISRPQKMKDPVPGTGRSIVQPNSWDGVYTSATPQSPDTLLNRTGRLA